MSSTESSNSPFSLEEALDASLDKYFPAADFAFPTAEAVPRPTADSFDLDLDAYLSTVPEFTFQERVLPPDPYALRADIIGPPSAITASSESLYEANTSYSFNEYSVYDQAISHYQPSAYSLDMEFARLSSVSDYGVAEVMDPRGYSGSAQYDPSSFGALPPSPPTSPPTRAMPRAHSDYSPVGAMRMSVAGVSVAPQRVSVPSQAVMTLPDNAETESNDGRRKHKCPNCFRSFARAFNLKTHMDTHDPGRPKGHVCPHASCRRAFSRKHDLQRHRAAIHRDSSSAASVTSSRQSAIGVERGERHRCADCGLSTVGREVGCGCRDVK